MKFNIFFNLLFKQCWLKFKVDPEPLNRVLRVERQKIFFNKENSITKTLIKLKQCLLTIKWAYCVTDCLKVFLPEEKLTTTIRALFIEVV